jgi:AcrR family transcriptional regulator
MAHQREAQAGRRSSAATLERIFESAEVEFREHGLTAGRVQEIAESAGVTKQLIYHYFSTKEALYQSLLERISDRYDELFETAAFDQLPPDEAIRLFVSRHLELHAGNGGNLLRDVALHSGEALHSSRRRHQLVKVVSTCLDRIVQRGRAAGMFTNGIDTPALLLMINFITNGAAATGSYLVGLISADVPSCPPDGKLEEICADFILLALTSRSADRA